MLSNWPRVMASIQRGHMHVPAGLKVPAGRKLDLIHGAPSLPALRGSPAEASCLKGRVTWGAGAVL